MIEHVVVAAARTLIQLVLVLAVARALGVVAARAGLTPVVGELFTGFVLGQSILGLVAPDLHAALFGAGLSPVLNETATLGMVALLLVAGMEIDVDLLFERARSTVAIAVGGTVVPFAATFALALALPGALIPVGVDRITFALFFGTALSVSAIPVIVRVLDSLDAIHSDVGQTSIAAATLTDLPLWMVLALVLGMSRGEFSAGSIGQMLLALVGFLTIVALIGPWIVRRFVVVGGTHQQVLSLAAVTLTTVTIARAIHVELGIAAFVVGILIAFDGSLTPEAQGTVLFVTSAILAPLFFGFAGLRADASALVRPDILALLAVTLTVASLGKIVGAYAGAWLVGIGHRTAIGLGGALNAGGAIGIIVAAIGLEAGMLTPEVYAVLLGVAVLTSVMASPIIRWSLGGS